MLYWKLQYNQADTAYGSALETNEVTDDWDYIDQGTVDDGPLTLAIDGVGQTSFANHQIIFGSAREDVLTGDKLEDHLYGGKGDDTLVGGDGADYLEGGDGFDTYNAMDGDTLFDLDGLGRVIFENNPLQGGTRQDDGSYRSGDGIFTYQLTDDTLTVTGFNKSLTINDFTAGDLGITLDDAAPEPEDTTHTILGDRLWKDFDSDEPGIQTRNDALGNKILDPANSEVPDQDDELYDSTGNDLIQSGGGEDVISAWRGGDDHIQAGSGRDKVYGGDGQDLIEGGADVIHAGTGDDHVWAGAGDDVMMYGERLSLRQAA
jgi:Ca2+-binding RTX toxin-like protein